MTEEDELVDEDEVDFHGEMDDGKADAPAGSVVADFAAAGCSTSVVAPLSRQIAEEMLCMVPGAFVRLEEGDGISFGSSAVLPYMDAEAAVHLRLAAMEAPLTLNSGFRTVVQQLLLREWFQRGRCGITAAARPGRSNHETGRAIDVSSSSSQRAALRRHGWTDPLSHDPVHFEHRTSPDLRGLDVHAFQRLWNRNNPGDSIDEDGTWGNTTRSKLLSSPAAGFQNGPTCEQSEPTPEDVGMCFEDAIDVDACCTVDGSDGVCIDTTTTPCSGSLHSGHCPGPTQIRCCIP